MIKKIGISIILIIVCMSNCVFAIDYNKDKKERKEACQEALVNYLEPFKSESVPEAERIINYNFIGYSISYEDDEKIKFSISFIVTPYSEENTIWEARKENHCYATFKIENGEYKLERISKEPEKLEKFLERFEEYKRSHPEIEKKETEAKVVPAQDDKYYVEEKIKKVSINLFVISSVIFIVSLIIIIKLIKKNNEI